MRTRSVASRSNRRIATRRQAEVIRTGPALKPHQQAVLRLQRQHGNQFVQRHLNTLQREASGKKEKASDQEGQATGGGFDLGEFISEKVYEAIKEHLSEAKLKGYATQVATTAADEVIKLINAGQTDPNALEQAADALSKKLLKGQLEEALKAIFTGPAGQQLRTRLLAMSQDPHKAVGLAILGLAAMVAANAEIPQLKKSFKLGAGIAAEGSATLGKFQEIAIKQVNLGLKYSSKYFKSGVSVGYSEEKGGVKAEPAKGDAGGEGGASGQAHILVGTEEVQAKLTGKLTPAGNFNINLGSALNLEKFALSMGGGYDKVKGWTAVGELRLGPKEGHLSMRQSFNPNGESSLTFGPKLNHDVITAMAMLNMSAADQTLDTSVALKQPLGIPELSLKAYLLSDLDDGVIKKAGLEGNWTLHREVNTQGVTQSLILLTFDAKFVAAGADMPASGQGAVVLQGLW